MIKFDSNISLTFTAAKGSFLIYPTSWLMIKLNYFVKLGDLNQLRFTSIRNRALTKAIHVSIGKNQEKP